jgi:BsuBI/PstI restriction endonuclease domain
MSPLRHLILEERAAKSCKAGIVYVSVFKDRTSFARWIKEISWETEVWLVESPDHVIHFNGERYLGPHLRSPYL